jgi:uncharacterized protein YggE
MRQFLQTTVFLISASLAFGQLESDTVTIQASRSMNVTPDQTNIFISVSASPNTSLDQILAALSNSGITAVNLSGVSGQSPLQWSFALAVPFTKMKATIASLTGLQQSIAKNNSGMSLTFQVQGAYVSPQTFQSQSCSAKDLVGDAQAQAQNVADAAGFAVGPVLAISNGSSATTGAYVANAWFAVSLPSLLLGYTTTPSGCSLEVKFKLLRYQ